MPVKQKTKILRRNSVLTVFFASLFVFVYFLILIYTYESLTKNAEDEIINATSNAATSLSRTISADSTKIDALAEEINSKIDDNILEPENSDKLVSFLAKKSPENSIMSTFFYGDGTFITSIGISGSISSIKDFEDAIAGSSNFATNVAQEYSPYIHYFRKISDNNGNLLGYITTSYDYTDTLLKCYNTSTKVQDVENVIFTSDGTIITLTDLENKQLKDVDNICTFLNANHYDGKLPSEEKPLESTVINSYIYNGNKYIVAISNVDDIDDVYIARIMPSSSMFASVGKLIVFMILATFLFFFVLVVIAYRYYKNITETSNRIKEVAFTDPLTGYPNYAKFKDDAETLINNNDEHKKYYIGCIDIVGFRYINDAFGYETGDAVLIQICHEINDLLTDDELFCRLSGDKFIVLSERDLSDTDNNMFIYQLADRISSIQPLSKSHIRLEVQMGYYAIKDEDVGVMSVNAYYDRCLIALYTINHTDTAVALYDESIYNEQLERMDIESRMHKALTDGEFRVYVQPKYRTSNAKLAAGEALIRWIDPEKGIVPPIKFIPLFEQNRFVHDVDLYVMEVVARFQRMRLNEGLPVVPISLNISPVEIMMPGFCESYISIKDKYDIPDKLIELEFTEGIFFDNETLFKEVIQTFHDHGFTCSMDDFGSGYSSLNILKDLPVDTLKLDKLFFRESDNTARDRSIIRSVVAMARSLNIKTVAEGVETLDVVDFLKLIGCTLIQGYIYSKPLPLTEFEEKLNTENIDTDDEFELDFDKFEVVPLDMPLSNSIDDTLRRTYAAIIEINASGNIYHIYYPGESDVKFDAIPERGFYVAFCDDIIPKYVHPKDLDRMKQMLNPIGLTNHFKKNTDLDLEYRQMRKDGSYSWMKLHIIKASGGRSDSQIFFGYFNVIDSYKETEENLSVAQDRFSAAYNDFNGVVFELDLQSESIDVLETHSSLLAAVKDVHEYKQLYGFIIELLVHPDYKDTVASYCSLEYIKNYFLGNANKPSLSVEIQAKPSRKVSRYNFYRATFSAQANPNKVLLTIEDITAHKIEEGASNLRHVVTDAAFANTYERICSINLDRDLFRMAVYPQNGRRKANVTEGKYSLHWKNSMNALLKPEDVDNAEQLTSLEGLINFYEDTTTNEFKILFREKASEDSDIYYWKESLIVSAPKEYGQDRTVYIFIRNVDDLRSTEQNLNEFAHRLSYSLAMYDYAYSVDCVTEKVEIIGGLMFDNDIFSEADPNYQDITTKVKNSIIAESDQAAFRRLTYLDELIEHFKTSSATLTKSFHALDYDNKIVEITIIYGAREQKITFFIRKLDKSLFLTDNNQNN